MKVESRLIVLPRKPKNLPDISLKSPTPALPSATHPQSFGYRSSTFAIVRPFHASSALSAPSVVSAPSAPSLVFVGSIGSTEATESLAFVFVDLGNRLAAAVVAVVHR
jgi:hypothetical protein